MDAKQKAVKKLRDELDDARQVGILGSVTKLRAIHISLKNKVDRKRWDEFGSLVDELNTIKTEALVNVEVCIEDLVEDKAEMKDLYVLLTQAIETIEGVVRKLLNVATVLRKEGLRQEASRISEVIEDLRETLDE